MGQWDWRVINSRITALGGQQPLAGYRLLLIQHGLPDLIQLIDAFVRAGMPPEHLTVIGIPYSTKPEVAASIQARFPGVTVDSPTVVPFDGHISLALLRLLKECKRDGTRLLILEDGGYAVPLVSQFAALGVDGVDAIVGAVEQTTRGANLDRALERAHLLRVPVIAIPSCGLKGQRGVEPPAIANAVNRNLRELLIRVPGVDPSSIKVVGILGLGAIGMSVVQHQLENGARVYGTDYDNRRVLDALTNHRFGQLNEQTIPECDLVIGTTGGTSIGSSVLPLLKDGAILASASSRQIEIDVGWLDLRMREIDRGGETPCVMPIQGYRKFISRKDTKRLTLLYDGYPINFFGDSLPDDVADVVLSLLFEAVVALTRTSYQPFVLEGNEVLGEQEIEIAGEYGWIPPPETI